MAELSEILRSGEGDALLWFCPGCQMAHQIWVGPGRGARWSWNGDPVKPTFNPSVLVRGKRRITDAEYDRIRAGEKLDIPDLICHVFIVDGNIQFLADCTHELAGQTVPIPPFHPDDD